MEHTNNNTTRTVYKQLSESERIKIAQLYLSGLSIREISRRTTRSPSTISREIRRNGRLNQPSRTSQRAGINAYRYTYLKAQKTRDERFVRPKSLKKFSMFIVYANNAIDPFVTLEDIYWNFQKKFPSLPCPCLKTIYNWAHKGIIMFTWGEKPVKRHTQKSNKEPIEGRKSIHERKKDFGIEINDDKTPGHFQIDTIYDADKRGGGLTLNETAHTLLYSKQLPDRKATTTNKALRQLIEEIGPENILSITSDNGVEFAYSKVIEECYDIKWYYCDPYSSYQRGQNERLNRDIRRFIPKSFSIKNNTPEEYQSFIKRINEKPRRKFGGLSAIEHFRKGYT